MKFSVSLKSNRDFLRLYKRGKSAASPLVVIYCRGGRTSDFNRLGITVSTKIGKAVVRNRIRRRLKEIYRTNEHRFIRGRDIVIVARTKSRYATYSALEADVLRLMAKLELLGEQNEEIINITD